MQYGHACVYSFLMHGYLSLTLRGGGDLLTVQLLSLVEAQRSAVSSLRSFSLRPITPCLLGLIQFVRGSKGLQAFRGLFKKRLTPHALFLSFNNYCPSLKLSALTNSMRRSIYQGLSAPKSLRNSRELFFSQALCETPCSSAVFHILRP